MRVPLNFRRIVSICRAVSNILLAKNALTALRLFFLHGAINRYSTFSCHSLNINQVASRSNVHIITVKSIQSVTNFEQTNVSLPPKIESKLAAREKEIERERERLRRFLPYFLAFKYMHTSVRVSIPLWISLGDLYIPTYILNRRG